MQVAFTIRGTSRTTFLGRPLYGALARRSDDAAVAATDAVQGLTEAATAAQTQQPPTFSWTVE